jgi:precorrin-6A synthase
MLKAAWARPRRQGAYKEKDVMAEEHPATKKVLVIGIGAGNLEHLTIQAVEALNRVDVFFVIDKGREKADLVDFRRQVCERYVRNRTYRWIEAGNPKRGTSNRDYRTDVESWRDKRASIFRELIDKELKAGECGAFLVWGDPCLYDGTLQILEDLQARGRAVFEYEVIPGVSSMQALAASHRIALNRIGEAIHVTTGRRLAQGFPEDVENVVVFLDNEMDLQSLPGDLEIFWGAYLGTGDEVTVSGRLGDRLEDIVRIRSAKKAEKGWIMDTYLLRRPMPGDEP